MSKCENLKFCPHCDCDLLARDSDDEIPLDEHLMEIPLDEHENLLFNPD